MYVKGRKKTTNIQIIEIISCKESIDSLIKSCFNNNINNQNEEGEECNIIFPTIYPYEISILDTNKISKNICEELYDLLNIKINKFNNNNNIMRNNNFSDNKELSLNLSEIEPGIEMKEQNDDEIKKNNLEILIKSELDTFILNDKKDQEGVNNLLNNLCIIISTKLQLLDVDNISSKNLKNFFLYYFKSVYYDSIIESKFKFINKEYKLIKKEGLKQIDYLKNELNILKNFEEKKNLSNNGNYANCELTNQEKEYLELCSKGNNLLKQKDEINKIIIELETDIQKIKTDTFNELNILNNELNEVVKKIKNLSNNEENQKLKFNDDIINYRKIISDKFAQIKKQLQNYKNKYGSSLGIYNRLIDEIKITINESYTNKEISSFNNINCDLIDKLIPLTQNTICYFREITNINIFKKFNPIEEKVITNESLGYFNFIKTFLVLNKSFDSISFISSDVNFCCYLNQIDNTILNTNLKSSIEIHRDYRKYISHQMNNNAINDFVKIEKKKNPKWDDKFIEKSALNKYFNFSILLNQGKKIEILFCSYEDFKIWINGFAFILKNKNKILNLNNFS